MSLLCHFCFLAHSKSLPLILLHLTLSYHNTDAHARGHTHARVNCMFDLEHLQRVSLILTCCIRFAFVFCFFLADQKGFIPMKWSWIFIETWVQLKCSRVSLWTIRDAIQKGKRAKAVHGWLLIFKFGVLWSFQLVFPHEFVTCCFCFFDSRKKNYFNANFTKRTHFYHALKSQILL